MTTPRRWRNRADKEQKSFIGATCPRCMKSIGIRGHVRGHCICDDKVFLTLEDLLQVHGLERVAYSDWKGCKDEEAQPYA